MFTIQKFEERTEILNQSTVEFLQNVFGKGNPIVDQLMKSVEVDKDV